MLVAQRAFASMSLFLPVIFVLLVGLGALWALVVLVSGKMNERSRRETRKVAAFFLLFGAAIYCYFVMDIFRVQFDTEDFFAPSASSQREKYDEACAGPLREGTPLADVYAWLERSGIDEAQDPNRDLEKRIYYNGYETDGVPYIRVADQNVRNQSLESDIAVSAILRFEDGVVASCRTEITTYGRR